MTCWNGISDFTLGSQFSGSIALISTSPVSALFSALSSHRDAATTCTGKVAAISICISRSSGYRAIGASMASSWATLNSVVADGDLADFVVVVWVTVVRVTVAAGTGAEATGWAKASGGGKATANDVTQTRPRTSMCGITASSIADGLASDDSFVALALADDAFLAGVLLTILQRGELGRVDGFADGAAPGRPGLGGREGSAHFWPHPQPNLAGIRAALALGGFVGLLL